MWVRIPPEARLFVEKGLEEKGSQMTTKSIQCREHGGTFEIEARRGRPPVRCSDENPCTRAPRAASKARVAEALGIPEVQAKVKSLTLAEWRKAAKDAGFSAGVINKMRTPAMFRDLLGGTPQPAPVSKRQKAANGVASVTAERHLKGLAAEATASEAKARQRRSQAVEEAPEVTTRRNPSVPMAHAARAALEPQGWNVAGRASFEGDAQEGHAHVIATRGEEMITLRWINGKLVNQSYSLWNIDKPSKNNAPDHKLPFDPDEMTDNELVRAMSGMKVTWWNRIASATETAVVSKDNIKVIHSFDGGGDEIPAERVVSFVDMNGAGFRAFRMGALLKIG